MPKPTNPDAFRQATLRRNTADGRLEEVALGGRIRVETLQRLMELIPKKTKFTFHIELAVNTGCLLKTLDNEADAQETIARLEAAPDREQVENADVQKET